MLRSVFIYLSKAAWAQRIITNWKFAWSAASRFVAGNTIQQAIEAVRDLNSKGINATLDHLGESTSTREEAMKAADDVIELLEQINCCEVRANVSIKLTQIGLALDSDLCRENLERILRCAKKNGNFIRLDMEDTPYTDQTISMLRHMRQKGFDGVGLVLQSYLFRTEKDLKALLAEGIRFRMVKGAYKEPKEVAYPKKSDVDNNFDRLTKIMIDWALQSGAQPVSSDGRVPPITALGTHDPKRIQYSIAYAEKVSLQKGALEFQMLYGIRRDLQEKCHLQGYPVRIYIPYGTHWYPYFMRRLAERPANVWFFISNFLRK